MRKTYLSFLVLLTATSLSITAVSFPFLVRGSALWHGKDETAIPEEFYAAEEIEWKTNFEEARMQAGREGKLLLLNFTGSDWCGWCMRLDREVFSKPEFIAYAKEKLVCVKLDFPKRKKLPERESDQNNQLAMKYGIQGFPTVLLVDDKGKLLLETGYQYGGAQAYVKHLQKAMR